MEASMIIEEGWLAAIGSYQVIVLTLGAVVFMGVMLSTKRRLRRYRQTTKLPTRDNAGQVARDVEDVMAELDELARQINGRLDTRFTKLRRPCAMRMSGSISSKGSSASPVANPA